MSVESITVTLRGLNWEDYEAQQLVEIIRNAIQKVTWGKQVAVGIKYSPDGLKGVVWIDISNRKWLEPLKRLLTPNDFGRLSFSVHLRFSSEGIPIDLPPGWKLEDDK